MSAPTPHAGRETIDIRSFRIVFAIERRLHKFDRWRLPLPYGVPVRGIAYAAATLAAVVLAGQLPGLGALLGALPAPLRFVLIPIAVATLLARVRVDGRPAHRFLLAWLRHRLSPPSQDAFTTVPATGSTHAFTDDVVLADDPGAPTYRAAEVQGPATVALLLPASMRIRRRRLEVKATPGEPLRRAKVVRLEPGQRLKVRSTRAS